MYVQRQLKSPAILPPFKPPAVYDPSLTTKQQEADRAVITLALPRILFCYSREMYLTSEDLEYLLEAQAREAQQDKEKENAFINKVENVLDAIAVSPLHLIVLIL